MTGDRRAFAVLDLGFGDAGKGLVTDWLTRRTSADVIVRFNGGAQAGHNVVLADGRHHTFAQLGAGSFVPGVRTLLSRHVAVHPTALVLEAEALARKGVPEVLARTAISENAPLVTPFHQAANRLRELARGRERHGSCGVGVGETFRDAELHPAEAVRAADLRDLGPLVRKLGRARERLAAELADLRVPRSGRADREREIFTSPRTMSAWVERCAPIASCVASDARLSGWISGARAVIFEGAQGLLLDESLGFHPHTTWSRCTADRARELLAQAAPGARLRVLGVLRAHAVRHGPGPLPTEDPSLQDLVVEHNRTNPWQGPVRRGWFDAVLARYALALARTVDALSITHVDALARRESWWACHAYELGDGDHDLVESTRDGCATHLVADPRPSLARQERLGRLLARCRPRLRPLPSHEAAHLAFIEDRLGRKVDLLSRGPAAEHVELRTPALFEA